jgi:hypothetical protein
MNAGDEMGIARVQCSLRNGHPRFRIGWFRAIVAVIVQHVVQ